MRSLATVLLPGLLLGLSGKAAAQDVAPDWFARQAVGTSLASGIQAMTVDGEGVIYLTGTSGSGSNTNVTTAAFAADGAPLWTTEFDGPTSGHDQARGIALGPDGKIFVSGNTAGPDQYANVLVLVRDGLTGLLLDTVQYSSGGSASEHAASVAVDEAGRIYVAGGTTGDGGDALIVAFDAEGDFLWKRVWDGPAEAPFSQDSALEIARDPQGDLLVLIHGVMATNHPDFVVLKLAAADGATIWEANWGTNAGDHPRDLEVDAAGDVYVTGTVLHGGDSYGTVKLSGSDGSLLWEGWDAIGYHIGAAALAIDATGVYVTGSSDPDGDESNLNDNIFTVRRDAATGAFGWSRLYGANCLYCFDAGADLVADGNGRLFVAGRTSSPPYNNEVILLALDASDGTELARGIASGGEQEAVWSRFVAYSPSWGVHLAGTVYGVDSGAVEMAALRWAGFGAIFCDSFEDGLLDGWSETVP